MSGTDDHFIRWLRESQEDERITQAALDNALHAFDPDWKMQSGDHLTDEDYDFLASCNVSWEYNNKENHDE